MLDSDTKPDLFSWPRIHHVPGGGNPQLFYKIHGTFPSADLEVSLSRYRSAGVPAGCELQLFQRASHEHVLAFGLDELFGQELKSRAPEVFAAAASAPDCWILQGRIEDPATLDYFRDAVGVVMAALDSGGVAVFDPYILDWWTPAEWRERAFLPDPAVPRHHVVILVSEEDTPDLSWYHTRGMLKFGRPDISVHDVPAELESAVEEMCARFIEMQAFGAVVPEGEEIRVEALPARWRCTHRGDLEDPDFNNPHILIGPPP
jgi:hypothetical protein